MVAIRILEGNERAIAETLRIKTAVFAIRADEVDQIHCDSGAGHQGPFTRHGIEVVISIQGFAFETSPDGVRHGRTEAMLVAYDRDGKIINVVQRRSRLALEPAAYAELQRKGLPFHLEIDVPAGDVYLRSGIYDMGSGNAVTLGFPLTARTTPSLQQ